MRPLIVLIASLVSMVLIFFLQTVHFETPEMTGFPLAIWMIVFVPLWAFRAYLEVAGKFDDKKAWCVTLNMASIFTMIATIAIFILQGTTPNWWSNITGSRTGKFFLFALIPLIFLIYILPGTGSGTVRWGKRIAVVLGIFIFLGLLGSAIGGGSSSKRAYRTAPAYASASIQAPAPVYKAPKDYSGRYKICWESLEGKRRCIFPCITAGGESLSADYNHEGTRFDFTGRGGDSGKYSGEYVLTWPDGRTRTRDFSLDFEKKSGCLEIKAGVYKEVTIKKLS